MAVEVVFLSVVLRTASLFQLPLGQQREIFGMFRWQEDWLRQDSHLIATSFMAPADVRSFGMALEGRAGLRRGLDWAVVDAMTGPIEPAPWLTFRGGPGEATGAWLTGDHPGVLMKIRSLLPSFVQGRRASGKVAKAFNRDTHLDESARSGPDLDALPAWGGRHLWMLEVVPDPPANDGDPITAQIIFEATGLDFMNYAHEAEEAEIYRTRG